ncbi:MAG: PDZ domain-containing protein [Elusimicrobia bacterium]|nr:PDZ domain-containing protein [Elusimicrobiota bacterium]
MGHSNEFGRKKPMGLAVSFIALAACGNPYRLNYVSVLDRLPAQPAFAPSTPTPRLVEAKNPREDSLRLVEEGYAPIGYVKFNSVKADEQLALAQAKELGADVVLTSIQFTNVVNESVPTTVYKGPETVRVEDRGNVGYTGVNYNRSQTVTYEGSYQTEFVNRETAFYDQKALFFRKLQAPVFGGAVSALPEEVRNSLGRNRGVVVRAVVNGSPAFRADVLKGDILIGLEGEDIIEPGEFYKRIESLAGRSVSLSILRNGQALELPVKLGERPVAAVPAAPK